MTTTTAVGEPIPHYASPSLTLATSIDDSNDARCMAHDHAMAGTHSLARSSTNPDQQPQRQRQ